MKKGFTIIELLVSISVFSLILIAATNFYVKSLSKTTRERLKAFKQNEIKEVFRLIEDDIRHADFGYDNKTDNDNNDNKSIAIYALDKCGSSSNETFCKPNTSRIFIADGWQIIRDFTQDNCPDGDISDTDYEIILNKFKAEVVSYTAGNKNITLDTLNIDSKCRKPSSSALCGSDNNTSGCNDIKDNKALIIARCHDSSNNFGVEGRRIGGVNNTTITFVDNESPLTYNICNQAYSVAFPAVVWYVRKNSNGIFSLYRNERQVIEDVENFVVRVGYDSNDDGVVDDSEKYESIPANSQYSKLKFFEISISFYYTWKNKKYLMNFKTSIEAFH